MGERGGFGVGGGFVEVGLRRKFVGVVRGLEMVENFTRWSQKKGDWYFES